MEKYIVGILFIFLTFISCDNRVTADFKISNYSGMKIDSLKIEPNINKKEKYISIKPSDQIKYKADMTTIAKTDGAYVISFILNGKPKSQMFGYYTNGYPLEEITKIRIEKDTIRIDQIFGDY